MQSVEGEEMTPEERRKKQRDVMDAFGRLNTENREKLLRYAEHLAEHRLLASLYMGEDDNPEPSCLLLYLN
jgi:hypothetical protein